MFNSMLALLDKKEEIEIRSSLCGHTYSNKFSCQLCTDNCPTKGLVWSNRTWQIEDCNMCGKCVALCPSHVFKFSENNLIKNSSPEEEKLLTCNVLLKEIPESCEVPVLNIPCLSQLYPKLLLFLLAKQATLNIFLVPERCEDCLNFNYQTLKNQINLIGDFSAPINWLTTWDSLSELTDLNKENLINRREFFNTMFRRSKKISHEVISNSIAEYEQVLLKQEKGTGTKAKAQKRLFLLAALQIFKQKNIPFTIRKLPYHKIQIDKCEFCGICTRLCPSDALEIKEVDNKKTLHFHPLKCTNCGLCQDVCTIGDISYGEKLELEDLINKQGIVVAAAEAVTCYSCDEKAFFYPDTEEKTCYPCRLRSNMPKNLNLFTRQHPYLTQN